MAETPEEILCAFMEPKPKHTRYWQPGTAWWVWSEKLGEWVAQTITLNECHEIEARLTNQQWDAYEGLAMKWRNGISTLQAGIHATAEQKIAALARVIGKESR